VIARLAIMYETASIRSEAHVHELHLACVWREDQERAAGLATGRTAQYLAGEFANPKLRGIDSACERESEKVDDLRFVGQAIGTARTMRSGVNLIGARRTTRRRGS